MKTSEKNTVSVVIPNWNGSHLLSKNLPAILEAAEYSQNNIIEIVVVDDGSTDDSLLVLKGYSKDVRIVRHEKNRGFSAAVNTGVRQAKGKLICLLNTDVIPSPKFLSLIPAYFNDKKLFAVGLHEKNAGPSTAQFVNGYFKHASGKETKKSHISMWASGGSAVFSRSIWWKLHGLDEELYSPFYWEDVDIGYRAWKRGYKIYWEPNSEVVHAHESIINNSNFKKRYMNLIKERNELFFIWKNISSESLIKKHKAEILKRALNHPGYLAVIWLALRKINLVKSRRLRERRESVLSDEAVFAFFK